MTISSARLSIFLLEADLGVTTALRPCSSLPTCPSMAPLNRYAGRRSFAISIRQQSHGLDEGQGFAKLPTPTRLLTRRLPLGRGTAVESDIRFYRRRAC